MSKKRPYYSLHQIQTGKFTKGNEYRKDDGTLYTGPYHILPNLQKFTGFVPLSNSEELHDVSLIYNGDIVYNTLTTIKSGNYISPIYTIPTVDSDDYNNGYITRYFVQQKTNPRNSIIEIDRDQFVSINITNGPGINGFIWFGIQMKWTIRGNIEAITSINGNVLNSTELYFPGIKNYILNLIEFVN